MADAITWGNDIGLWALWPAKIPEKCGNTGKPSLQELNQLIGVELLTTCFLENFGF